MKTTLALKIFTAGLKKDLTAILFLRSRLTAKKRCTDVNALKKRNRQAPDAKKINSGSSRCTPAPRMQPKEKSTFNQSNSLPAESGTAVEPGRDAKQSAKHRTK